MQKYLTEAFLGLFFAAVILLVLFTLAINDGSTFVYQGV